VPLGGSLKDVDDLSRQKQNVWNMISLAAQDQLRQRMAWVLSQILPITPYQINESGLSEIYLNYHDIFVRNAFGNYRDVLREVSLSPMMAEMLSFLESKSSAYVLRTTGTKARPDENFAREAMQLFTMGVYSLNIDGTPILDADTGLPIPTYDNTDIQTFARAWTGFQQQEQRGNIELWEWEPNRIDPLRINPRWRDVFPKQNLYNGFIGDSYPLCSDLPEQQFLKTGAQYILLGSSSFPEFQSGDEDWWLDDQYSIDNLVRLALDPSSNLYGALCDSATPGGECRFKAVVTLDENLQCQGVECDLDNIRTVRVSENPAIYYEYIRPACVEMSFYNTGKKIKQIWPNYAMCANTAVDDAYEACCPRDQCWGWGCGQLFCEFTGERVKYDTASNRCQSRYGSQTDTCDWDWISSDGSNSGCTLWTDDNWHWTDQDCSVRVKGM